MLTHVDIEVITFEALIRYFCCFPYISCIIFV